MNCGRDQVNLTAEVGEWTYHTMTIRNAGNSDCSVELKLADVPSNVEVRMNHETLDFTSFGQATLRIKMRQNGGSGSLHTFTLSGINSVRGENADFLLEFNFDTEGDPVSADLLSGLLVVAVSVSGILVLVLIPAMVLKIIRRVKKKSS
jgi:hypothetical protein